MRMQQYVMMARALQATDLFHMFVEETPWTVRVVHPVYVMERHRSSGWAVGAGNKRTEHIPCPCSMCNSVQPLSWCLQEAQHTVWTLYVVILQAAYQRKRCSNMSLMAFWRDSSIWSTAFQATGRCITATSSSKQSWKAGRIRSRRLVDWSKLDVLLLLLLLVVVVVVVVVSIFVLAVVVSIFVLAVTVAVAVACLLLCWVSPTTMFYYCKY